MINFANLLSNKSTKMKILLSIIMEKNFTETDIANELGEIIGRIIEECENKLDIIIFNKGLKQCNEHIIRNTITNINSMYFIEVGPRNVDIIYNLNDHIAKNNSINYDKLFLIINKQKSMTMKSIIEKFFIYPQKLSIIENDVCNIINQINHIDLIDKFDETNIEDELETTPRYD